MEKTTGCDFRMLRASEAFQNLVLCSFGLLSKKKLEIMFSYSPIDLYSLSTIWFHCHMVEGRHLLLRWVQQVKLVRPLPNTGKLLLLA